MDTERKSQYFACEARMKPDGKLNGACLQKRIFPDILAKLKSTKGVEVEGHFGGQWQYCADNGIYHECQNNGCWITWTQPKT